MYAKVKKSITELADISKASLSTRFKIAKSLSDEDDKNIIKEKILFWMLYLHMNYLKKPSYHGADMMKYLIQLNYSLSQPQFNGRLMLENFMLKI